MDLFRVTSRVVQRISRLCNEASLFVFSKEISEQVLVVMRPWVRVDGSLNRRVLDRFLGAVLGHCLSFPGLSLSRVCDYFDPALQPVHTRELLEVGSRISLIVFIAREATYYCRLFSAFFRFCRSSAASGGMF